MLRIPGVSAIDRTGDIDLNDEDEFNRAVDAITRLIESAEEEEYSEEVIREYRNPSNVGRMADADGSATFKGPCEDTMELYIKQKNGIIESCTFFTDGCGASIAVGSRLTKMVLNLSLEEAQRMMPDDIIESLCGLPESHRHCAELGIVTLRRCISDCQANLEKGKKSEV